MQINDASISLLSIVDELPIHIYWKDRDGTLLGCNKKTLESLGLATEDDYIGKTDYDLFPEEQADKLRRIDKEVMCTEKLILVEEIFNVAGGENALFLSVKKPLKNQRGDILGIMGLSINITELRKAGLNELHVLNSIVALIPGHVYWKNKEGNYLGCNNEQAFALGLKSRDEIKDKKPYSNLPPKEAEELLKNDKIVLEHGETVTMEEAGIRRNGEKGVFLTKKTPLYDRDQKITGILGVSLDITERKLIEEELIEAKDKAEAANKVKTEFIQNMQHDIRTPAAGVWSVLDQLAQKEKDAKQKEILTMLAKSSEKLLRLCNDVVDFGHLEEHEQVFTEKSIDIRQLADEILDLNKPAAFGKNLILNLKVESEVPIHIKSDEFRVRRILINLLGNAVKFTQSGSITLSVQVHSQDKQCVKLSIVVTDTGIGIPRDKLNSIFEKFSRVIPSNTNLYPGTGLGLYVVKKFVEELGGSLTVDSILEQGSTFTVLLPVMVSLQDINERGLELDEMYVSPLEAAVDNKSALLMEQSVEEVPFENPILLIEDDNVSLFAAHEVLSRLTLAIDIAKTVQEAKEKLQENKYDLVFSDLGLPDGSGIDIIRAAQEYSKNKATPFIAVTAHRDQEKIEEAIASGFKEVIKKPLTEEGARYFFEAYLAQPSQQSLATKSNLPVIDLKLGMKRLGVHSEDKAIAALGILLDSLAEDMVLLKQAEVANDVMHIRELLHKIRGGLNYSGAPSLQYDIEILHKMVKEQNTVTSLVEQFNEVYKQAMLLEKEYKKLVH